MKSKTWETLHSSRRQNWQTPQPFFELLCQDFTFELDVAADSKNALCERYFTESANGLSQPWTTEPGTWAFCNPPYGRQIARWVSKAIAEKRAGARVVLLLFAATDTQWFKSAWLEACEVRFYTGRIRFRNPDAPDLNTPAPKGSCVFVFDSSRKGRAVTLCKLK